MMGVGVTIRREANMNVGFDQISATSTISSSRNGR
jgi:hypothetical protein